MTFTRHDVIHLMVWYMKQITQHSAVTYFNSD